MRLDHPVLARQLGVFHVNQAVMLGLPRTSHGRYPGTWILPGVHSLLPAVTPQARWMAAVLWAGPGCGLTGLSAAAWWGWIPARSGPVYVSIPWQARRLPTGFVVPERSRVQLLLQRTPHAVASVPRTLLTCASYVPQRELTAMTAKAVQKRQATLAEISQLLNQHPRLPGVTALNESVQQLAGGSESIREVDSMQLFVRLGLPQPVQQVMIFDADGLVSVADFYWRGVAGFYDGASHLEEEAALADSFRRLRLAAIGLEVAPFDKRSMNHPRLLGQRLRAAIAKGANWQPPPGVEPPRPRR